MPVGLTSGKGLRPGDVLMVHHQTIERRTKNERLWRFFGVVVASGVTRTQLRRVVTGQEGQIHYYLRYAAGVAKAFKLEPEEWPDYVHQKRMELILTGEIVV